MTSYKHSVTPYRHPVTDLHEWLSFIDSELIPGTDWNEAGCLVRCEETCVGYQIIALSLLLPRLSPSWKVLKSQSPQPRPVIGSLRGQQHPEQLSD